MRSVIKLTSMPNVGPHYRGYRDYPLELEARLTSVLGSRDLCITLFIAAILILLILASL